MTTAPPPVKAPAPSDELARKRKIAENGREWSERGGDGWAWQKPLRPHKPYKPRGYRDASVSDKYRRELEGGDKSTSPDGPPLCEPQDDGRKCEFEGCNKRARAGGPHFCKGHGGGRRCQEPGCTKSAASGGTARCASHGGGKRCAHEGCKRSARSGGLTFCAAHGGGHRCQAEGCTKSARASSNMCSSHGPDGRYSLEGKPGKRKEGSGGPRQKLHAPVPPVVVEAIVAESGDEGAEQATVLAEVLG